MSCLSLGVSTIFINSLNHFAVSWSIFHSSLLLRMKCEYIKNRIALINNAGRSIARLSKIICENSIIIMDSIIVAMPYQESCQLNLRVSGV